MTPTSSALTARQREFLAALVKLWRQSGAPVHYSDLAQVMGVSRFSAYDMLRTLEAHGLVQASYALDHAGQTFGRTSVYYAPTSAGLAAAPAGASSLTEEWRAFRDSLLGRLAHHQKSEPAVLLDDLLGGGAERSSPLQYCSQVITALLLNLDQTCQKICGFNPLDALRVLTSGSGEMRFAMLAGLSLGAAMHAESEWEPGRSRQLLDHTHHFQERLRELSEDGKRLLSDFLQDAMDTIMRTTQEKKS